MVEEGNRAQLYLINESCAERPSCIQVVDKMVRIPLVNDVFKLVRCDKQLRPNQALFHVPLHYSKPMIKHYLKNLYGVQVDQVQTAILLGKTKTITTYRSRNTYKEPTFKKAYVTFKGEFFKDD